MIRRIVLSRRIGHDEIFQVEKFQLKTAFQLEEEAESLFDEGFYSDAEIYRKLAYKSAYANRPHWDQIEYSASIGNFDLSRSEREYLIKRYGGIRNGTFYMVTVE